MSSTPARRERAGDPAGGTPAGAQGLDELLQSAVCGDRGALQSLLVRSLDGEPDARDRLLTFARHHLARAARRHAHSPTVDPESMAQAGVLELLRRPLVLHRCTAPAFLAYLDRMARNWVHEQERRRRQRRQTSLGGSSSGHHKSQPAGENDLRARLGEEQFERVLAYLPEERDRFVLRKRFSESRSYEEIARLMTPPSSTDAVRMQASRALGRLGRDERVLRLLAP